MIYINSRKIKGNATIVMILIAVMIAGLIGLFAIKGFGLGNFNEEKNTVQNISGSGDELTDALNSQSDSDEINDIESDLNSTYLDDLDNELDDIDGDLESL